MQYKQNDDTFSWKCLRVFSVKDESLIVLYNEGILILINITMWSIDYFIALRLITEYIVYLQNSSSTFRSRRIKKKKYHLNKEN